MMAEVGRRRLMIGAAAAMVASAQRTVAATPRMEITPTSALQDVPLAIRLSGLAPSSPVKITAETTARDGSAWRSHAVFRADATGSADVAGSTPEEGTYRGVSPMGLVWS